MRRSLFFEDLGLYGWTYLEPVILASLASKKPMLLIGKHGSAKSFILERLAETLNLNYRFYNASLINYDDLVGIPIPDKTNTKLDYISHPNSIWDAEVVFIDEINRTKTDLQNKLFPIIYEKRIQGINLEKLEYTWAAMNPPLQEDEDDIYYGGTHDIDPALVDRFSFVINVPSWEDLTLEDKQLMLKDNHKGRHEFKVNIQELIEQTKTNYDVLVSQKDKISEYIITLMDLLKNIYGYFSSRRAMILEDTFLYLFAATKTVNDYLNINTELDDVTYLHIQNTLPTQALKEIDKTALIKICRSALDICKLDNFFKKEVLLVSDPIERLKKIIVNKNKLDLSLINDSIPMSISEIKDKKKRRAMALFTYLAFRGNSEIYASNIETLVNEIRPIFNPIDHTSFEHLRIRRCVDEAKILVNTIDENLKIKRYLTNFLYSFLPDGYDDIEELKSVFLFFKDTWKELDCDGFIT